MHQYRATLPRAHPKVHMYTTHTLDPKLNYKCCSIQVPACVSSILETVKSQFPIMREAENSTDTCDCQHSITDCSLYNRSVVADKLIRPAAKSNVTCCYCLKSIGMNTKTAQSVI
eukprot:scpid69741/ scgid29398/ 